MNNYLDKYIPLDIQEFWNKRGYNVLSFVSTDQILVYNHSNNEHYNHAMAPPLTKDVLCIIRFDDSKIIGEIRLFMGDIRVHYTVE